MSRPRPELQLADADPVPRSVLTLEDLEGALALGLTGTALRSSSTQGSYLTSACHRGRGLDVRYRQGSGMLEILCHVCQARVTAIAVAYDESYLVDCALSRQHPGQEGPR